MVEELELSKATHFLMFPARKKQDSVYHKTGAYLGREVLSYWNNLLKMTRTVVEAQKAHCTWQVPSGGEASVESHDLQIRAVALLCSLSVQVSWDH